MSNNSRRVTVECPSCAWQGDESLTDSRHCPECGDECLELIDIYGPNGLFPDPSWGEKESSGQQKGE